MLAQVEVKNGTYRNQDVVGIFELVKEWKKGKKGGFVTVRSDKSLEKLGAGPNADVRINVKSKDIKVIGEIAGTYSAPAGDTKESAPIFHETDKQTVARITETFQYIETLTSAAQKNQITGLIISGPAGVGKSYGVEMTLNRLNMQAMFKENGSEKFEIITGGTSGIGLYQKLWEWRKPGNVLVFDDCDSALFEEIQLNMLKAAMDTKKKRKICWLKESTALDKTDIPNSFQFEGSIIFLTNIKFDQCKVRKLAPHLEAIMSRVHYLDLCLDTRREQLLRVKQVVDAGMLKDRKLGAKLEKDVVNYVYDNVDHLTELSLRTVLKVADLAAICDKTWEKAASFTCLSHNGRKAKLMEAQNAAKKATA